MIYIIVTLYILAWITIDFLIKETIDVFDSTDKKIIPLVWPIFAVCVIIGSLVAIVKIYKSKKN
jgi:hypothetical protein